jgi:MinD-like ATPase involved in chromosome partitioning or flagellar assembly
MYVVTFYSYKGGVGRTMTLTNVAAELARRGKRVLLVDFDLEAPGITTYDFCDEPPTQGGIVEYILDYAGHRRPPNLKDFVSQCHFTGNPDSTPLDIWVMPAGRQDDGYKSRFRSINWEELYANKSGYLILENLKEQWRTELAPDYVFIDSRTGHTDVSGICTRQLPDAVVFTFFPNKQNLYGLRQVVDEVKREKSLTRQKNIALHFAATNTPVADDEDHILEDNLEEFRAALGYSECHVVHYYNSLLILNQAIFTLTRPNSQLAKEYVSLASAITKDNVEDREGALAFLDSATARLRRGEHRPHDLSSIESRITEIQKAHATDGEILSRLGTLHLMLGGGDLAADYYKQALALGYEGRDALSTLAILYTKERPSEAVGILKRLLVHPEALDTDVYFALRGLIDLDENSIPELIRRPEVSNRDPSSLLTVTELFRGKRSLLPLAHELLLVLITKEGVDHAYVRSAKNRLHLVEIGLGLFDSAMAHIGNRRQLLDGNSIPDVFNFAMAEWGKTGIPPRDLLERVAELDSDVSYPKDTNYAQCLALTEGLLGNLEAAHTWIERSRHGTGSPDSKASFFSCWSYVTSTTIEFLRDLRCIERMLDGDDLIPEFMRPAVVH